MVIIWLTLHIIISIATYKVFLQLTPMPVCNRCLVSFIGWCCSYLHIKKWKPVLFCKPKMYLLPMIINEARSVRVHHRKHMPWWCSIDAHMWFGDIGSWKQLLLALTLYKNVILKGSLNLTPAPFYIKACAASAITKVCRNLGFNWGIQ